MYPCYETGWYVSWDTHTLAAASRVGGLSSVGYQVAPPSVLVAGFMQQRPGEEVARVFRWRVSMASGEQQGPTQERRTLPVPLKPQTGSSGLICSQDVICQV